MGMYNVRIKILDSHQKEGTGHYRVAAIAKLSPKTTLLQWSIVQASL